jgi:hypothetical protein
MKTKTKIQDVMEALQDILPPGPSLPCEEEGDLFGDSSMVLGGANLQGFFAAGTLTYQTPDGPCISWDLDSMRVLQQDDLMFFTGPASVIQ